jgi:hypothetical protein
VDSDGILDRVLEEAADEIQRKFNQGQLTWLCNDDCEMDTQHQFWLRAENCASFDTLNEEVEFQSPFTIAGNIAGGISDPRDTRRTAGNLRVTSQGKNGSQRSISIASRLTFIVTDVIDFIPGQLGSPLEQWFGTGDLQELERNGWAFDVPFRVAFTDNNPQRTGTGETRLISTSNEQCDPANCDPCKQPNPPDSCDDTPRPPSYDPNDIVGPGGFGPEYWISPDQTFHYTVRFENDAQQALAPA